MRRRTVRALHVTAVLVSFLLVLEGPDLLLLGVRDARYWFPIGLVSGVLTLPLLWVVGIGFVPPWTMPAYREGRVRPRVAGYHLVCTTLATWLWTFPTVSLVAWVHERRGLAVARGAVVTDPLSVAGGLVLAELLFLLPAVVLFVRLSSFRTAIDLSEARASDLFRTALVAVGSYLLAGYAVTLLSAAVLAREAMPT